MSRDEIAARVLMKLIEVRNTPNEIELAVLAVRYADALIRELTRTDHPNADR